MAKKPLKTSHPDHSPNLRRVRRIRGQIEGIERMINERRYCPEIIVQVQAANAALKSLAASILDSHLHHCVEDALQSKNRSEATRKIDEVLELFKKGT